MAARSENARFCSLFPDRPRVCQVLRSQRESRPGVTVPSLPSFLLLCEKGWGVGNRRQPEATDLPKITDKQLLLERTIKFHVSRAVRFYLCRSGAGDGQRLAGSDKDSGR